MKLLKKINLFLFRIDGLISLAVAGVSFFALIQCVLGVQNGVEVLAVPVIVLLGLTFVMITRFFDWLLLIDRRTRSKVVRGKVNCLLETWRMKGDKYEFDD